MHHVLRAGDVVLERAYPERARGFRRCSLVDRAVGSVHMGLGLCALDAGGAVETHLHSFEESFFVLEGEPLLVLDGRGTRLRAGHLRCDPGRRAARVARARDRSGQVDRDAGAAAARPGAAADTFFTGGATEYEEVAAGHPRSPLAASLPARRRSAGPGQPQGGSAGGGPDGVREHGDRAARLQRHHGEDAGGPAAGRAACAHVHGRVPARRCRATARPSARGVLRDPRGRGRGRRRRRPLHAAGGRHVLDGRRLHPRVLQHERQARCAGSRRRPPQPPARHWYRFDRDWDYLERRLGPG